VRIIFDGVLYSKFYSTLTFVAIADCSAAATADSTGRFRRLSPG